MTINDENGALKEYHGFSQSEKIYFESDPNIYIT